MERKEPLNLTAEQIISLAKTGAELERRALGEEEQHQCTNVQVILRETPPDPEREPSTRPSGGELIFVV
jgi:hypothetical protein